MRYNLTDPFLPVDEDGFYGTFGGAFIPEILHSNIEKLKEAYSQCVDDPAVSYTDLRANETPENHVWRNRG
ncbi:MAG: hypothetical protein K2F94_02085, partial [Muribaculaceae bacterium]|nr:hypothetical protein [Muribaculaceae bacterium]